jgi:hypothetical protein
MFTSYPCMLSSPTHTLQTGVRDIERERAQTNVNADFSILSQTVLLVSKDVHRIKERTSLELKPELGFCSVTSSLSMCKLSFGVQGLL